MARKGFTKLEFLNVKAMMVSCTTVMRIRTTFFPQKGDLTAKHLILKRTLMTWNFVVTVLVTVIQTETRKSPKVRLFWKSQQLLHQQCQMYSQHSNKGLYGSMLTSMTSSLD